MGTGKTYSTKYLVDSNGNTGVAGQILVTTATGVNWQDAENTGDNQTQGALFDSNIVLIDTPNGGLKPYRVITDEYGEWIQVGRFAANARTSILGTWSSVSGLSTGISQSETTSFSADFGDSFPTEVRVMGATDFNNWRNTRTIDWVYKVPEGRKWKFFFSGGATNGMTRVPLAGTPSPGTRFGWGVNGAYDGFGRWTNADLAGIGMSDVAVTNPSAAYTTATVNAFNWQAGTDAKLTVNAFGIYSGQDQGTTSAVGNDDGTAMFYDTWPTETANGVGGTAFSSAVWVLIKLPGGFSGGGGGYWAANGNDIYNTNSANVGIGTDDPGSILDIVDTSSAATKLTIGRAGEVPLISAGGANTDLRLQAVGSGGFLDLNTGSTSTTRMRIDADGNVGINKTTSLTSHGLSILKTSSNQQLGCYYNETNFAAFGARSNGDVQIYGYQGSAGGTGLANILLGVDGSAVGGNVGIGIALPNTPLHVSSSSRPVVTLTSTDAGADPGPIIYLNRESASPADGDNIGAIYFDALPDAGGLTTYARIRGLIIDASDGAEEGGIRFDTTLGGDTGVEAMRIVGGNVGIGTVDPGARLDVKETTSDVAGEIIVGGLIASDDVPFGKISFANTATANTQTNDILASIAGEKVGSSNRGELTFSTSDSAAPAERMRIDSAGNVGIGADNPDAKLFIQYPDATTNTVLKTKLDAAYSMGISNDWVSTYESKLRLGRVTSDTSISNMEFVYNIQGTEYGSIKRNYSAASLKFERGTNLDMIIDGSGKVGIGVTSPQQLIHINNTSGDFGAEAVLRGSTSAGTPKSEIAFKRFTSGDGAEMVLRTSNSGGTLQDVMTLDTSGNVGIDRSALVEKFEVGGNSAFYGAIKGYTGSSSNQYLSILQSSSKTFISTGTTGETLYFGIGPIANVTNINVAGNITTPTQELSSTATPTSFGVYSSEIRLIETPNGGLKQCRVITDNYGEWILVGRFAANAMSTIQASWSSESGLDTSTAQSTTTKFSADFGDSYPTEVRIMGATDFAAWRDTRTVDFVYGVPEGRQWKYFFSGGATSGMDFNVKWGWTVNGAYDGFGRWVNPAQTFVRMSDGNVTNPSAAYTTATTNAFNWQTGGGDAKITVSSFRAYSGQDTTVTSGFGTDDGIQGFFDVYPSETNNMQGGTAFSSSVWVLIKIPNFSSGEIPPNIDNNWSFNGLNIYNTNLGNVGIGVNSPPVKLSINGWSYNPGAAAAAGCVGLKQGNNSAYGFVTEASDTDKWLMMGHNSSHGIIETTYAATAGHSDLYIKTGGANQLVLQSTGGNVLVNTTSSSAGGKFTIRADSSADSFGGNPLQIFENLNTTDGQVTSIGFRNNNSVGTTSYIDSVAVDQSIGATDLRFSTYSGSAWNDNLLVVSNNGNVGINTTSPDQLLDVSRTLTSFSGASTDEGAVIRISNPSNWESGYDGNGFIGGIEFHSGDASEAGPGIFGAIKQRQLSYYNTQAMCFFTSPYNGTLTERMRIDASGNVGIGNETNSIVVTGKGLGIQNIGNDTTASLRLTGHNNTGTPGVATYTELKHLGDQLKFVINHNGTDAITIGSSASTIAFAYDNTTELGTYVSTNFGGSVKRIRMRQGGEIHFGDTATSSPLGITEGTWDQFTDTDLLSIYARNRLNIYAYPGGATIAASFVSGTFTSIGDVVAYGSPSDKRLKENIKPIESALDKVSKLQGVTFDWKKSDSILKIKEDIGFIAQDVQKVIPELVRENEDGMLSMRHQGIAPILLEAIKELKAEIDLLKSKPCTCNKCNCNI